MILFSNFLNLINWRGICYHAIQKEMAIMGRRYKIRALSMFHTRHLSWLKGPEKLKDAANKTKLDVEYVYLEEIANKSVTIYIYTFEWINT